MCNQLPVKVYNYISEQSITLSKKEASRLIEILSEQISLSENIRIEFCTQNDGGDNCVNLHVSPNNYSEDDDYNNDDCCSKCHRHSGECYCHYDDENNEVTRPLNPFERARLNEVQGSI